MKKQRIEQIQAHMVALRNKDSKTDRYSSDSYTVQIGFDSLKTLKRNCKTPKYIYFLK